MSPNPFAWPFRAQFLLGGVVCSLLVAYALFEQFQMGLEPCPKCILQRIAFIAAGVVFFVGAAHGPGAQGRRIYAVLAALAAASGAVVAVRHVIVQLTPADPMLAGCGPGLNYLIDTFPLTEAIKKAFMGTGNCADVDWSLFGLSMPAWALGGFVVLGVGALWAGFRRRPM